MTADARGVAICISVPAVSFRIEVESTQWTETELMDYYRALLRDFPQTFCALGLMTGARIEIQALTSVDGTDATLKEAMFQHSAEAHGTGLAGAEHTDVHAAYGARLTNVAPASAEASEAAPE